MCLHVLWTGILREMPAHIPLEKNVCINAFSSYGNVHV